MLLGGDDTKVIDKGHASSLNKRDLATTTSGCLASAVVIGGLSAGLGPAAWMADLAYFVVCLEGAALYQNSQAIAGYGNGRATRSGGIRKPPAKTPKKPNSKQPKGKKYDADGNQIHGRCVQDTNLISIQFIMSGP